MFFVFHIYVYTQSAFLLFTYFPSFWSINGSTIETSAHTIHIHTHTQTALRWENEILQFHPPNFVFFFTVPVQAPSLFHELCFYQSFSVKKTISDWFELFADSFHSFGFDTAELSAFQLISLLLSTFIAFSVHLEQQLDLSPLFHSLKKLHFHCIRWHHFLSEVKIFIFAHFVTFCWHQSL